jgi:2-polyprenyl-6-methoxyphenol hydroxylase-like FAD-dependent oxidoreductase
MLNLVPVQDNNVNILVIGAGVSGLTTAICLREAGFNVIIIADRFTPDLTSVGEE